jgi:prepilin-type processing-associated H-X9-DG protein
MPVPRPSESQPLLSLGTRGLSGQRDGDRTDARICEPSATILAADCTADFAEPDADKDDCGALPVSPAFVRSQLHPGGSNVLFVDGHVQAFKAWDKERMTVWYEGRGYDYACGSAADP